MHRFTVLLGGLVFLPCLLQAQRRSPMVTAAPTVALVGPRSAPHASATTTAHVTAPAGAATAARPATVKTSVVIRTPGNQSAHTSHLRASSRNSTPAQQTSINPFVATDDREEEAEDFTDSNFSTVPGLGFDFPHLAATRGPDAVGARRHRLGSSFFPFFDGFFFPSAPSVIVEENPVEAPQENVVASDTPEPIRRTRSPERAAVSPGPYVAPEPQHDVSEYVFVRKDGTVFFAVGYTWENGVLRYVTSEGSRRSVKREILDLDATQQFNEQRGLTFRFPA